MRKSFFYVLAIIAAGLFIRVAYLVLSSPPEPALTAPGHEAVVAQLNHMFRQAAYAITWAIQLSYVAWLGIKWQSDKRAARTPL